jgi:hypothetical protein
MERLWNRIRAEIARQIAVAIAAPRMVIITGYDPATHTGKGLIMPEAAFPDQSGDVVESNFGPIATLSSGAGSGVYVGRAPNDQILVVYQEHDQGSPIAIGRVHTTEAPPPAVPSGEVWANHSSGSAMRLTNDNNAWLYGVAQANMIGGESATMTAPALYVAAGSSLSISAPASGGDYYGDMRMHGTLYVDTVVQSPQPGTAPSAPPAPADPSTPIS